MTALPRPIVVTADRLRDFATGSTLEWIETDGRGGYASSTAVGASTRRYHGVLVVARHPPTDRVVLLSRLEETLITPSGDCYDLAANVYPGTIHPTGHRWLEEFRLEPWPTWRYRLGRLTLTKTLFVAREPGATVVRYRLEGGTAWLEIRPLVAGRDFHALVVANEAVSRSSEAGPRHVVYRPYPGMPPLVLSHGGGVWHRTDDWYYATLYPRETERGLEDREDLYCPGVLSTELSPGRSWTLACGTRPLPVEDVEAWASAEARRRAELADTGRRNAGAETELDELGAWLGLSADAFLVERDGGWSILAGYPWFADWGRDAMISIPGLCLATGRLDEAGAVLRTFARHMRDGLIPNRFPDYGGEVPLDHYNAADASLWFIEATAALADVGGRVVDLWPAVQSIIQAYREGTHFGIRLEDDGLIRQGHPGMQLTWMDAKVDGWVVTPRDGKAVEINALWYNALSRVADLARSLGHDARPYETLARRAREAFGQFWYAAGRYLYDRIDDDGRPDPTLRPNQVFAASLPHSPLSRSQCKDVVASVEHALLVPLGVRTLAPDAPGYRGGYGGDRMARDSAYHQGTAWPWLLGPFAMAYTRAHGPGEATRTRIRTLLEPLWQHLGEFGLGHVAEVFAGDPPHSPSGCFAQAWSTAELLRVLRLAGGKD